MPAAIALRAGSSSRVGHGSGLWPHSPAIALRPVQHLPVHHDAAAHAGAEDHAEDDLGARARAVGRLGQREAVRVVLDAHLAAERVLEILA